MGDLISVIVPVYNAEKYLRKCVESICKQTYKDLEIILVDDGSTDKSYDLCIDLARHDKRIRVEHQENRGVSSARNYGLEKSNGIYVGFVDADDYIGDRMYENLHEIAVRENAEVVACCDIYESEWGEKISSTYMPEEKMTGIEAIRNYLSYKIVGGVCNKILKLSLIREKKLEFEPEIAYGEDLLFVAKYLTFCRLIYTIPEQYYHYVEHISSATNKVKNEQRFDKKQISMIDSITQLEPCLNMDDDIIKGLYRTQLAEKSYIVLHNMVSTGYKNEKLYCELKSNISANKKYWMCSMGLSWKLKLLMNSVCMGKCVYRGVAFLRKYLEGNC